MNLHRDVGFLRGLPLFQSFGEAQLQLLAFNCSHRFFDDGQWLFREGEEALSAFFIVSGAVALVGESGRPLHGEAQLGPGTVIGEASMIVRSHRPASARAVGEVEALEISRSIFLRVLREYPETADQIRRTMASRVAAFVTDLKAIQTDPSDEAS